MNEKIALIAGANGGLDTSITKALLGAGFTRSDARRTSGSPTSITQNSPRSPAYKKRHVTFS